MLDLYLTRHGETEWNVQKRMQGHLDSPLTEKGVSQARMLSERLTVIDFLRIYSSPSGRAMATAEIIRSAKKTEIITDSNLREINMGEWEGRFCADIEKEASETSRAFWDDPANFKPCNWSGEDFLQLSERLRAAISDIIKKHSSGNILVVTHGMSLKIIMSIFKGQSLSDLKNTKVLPSACLNYVRYEKGRYNVLLEGDTSHFK